LSILKKHSQNLKLPGSCISPGLAVGKAFIYRDILKWNHEFYDIEEHQIPAEYERIVQAIGEVSQDLKLSAVRVEEELDTHFADIFRAQEAILCDTSLAKEMRDELKKELVNAEEVVKRVFRRWERKFRQINNDLLSQRADDIADLCRRLLTTLEGIHAHTLEEMPEGSVLVARRLLPSDTVFLSRESTVAVVIEFGGPGSHAALLTREIGIPAVGQIPNIRKEVQPDDILLVDGSRGTLTIRPDAATLASFKTRIEQCQVHSARSRKRCHDPAVTLDGVKVEVMANITCREDLEQALENGADGIGLYRVESLYLSRKILPSDQELFEEMMHTLQPAKDRPVTIRLLDAGGDKRLPFLDFPHENDPFLGRRGIRLLLDYPDLLYTQLQTVLHLSRTIDVRILIPMVTLRDELKRVRQMLCTATTNTGIDSIPPLGAMVETPAAALCVADLVKYVDFFSIGTNDLTQYTMAAGRENPLVSKYFDHNHPAIFKLIQLICEGVESVPIALCGELAGDFAAVPRLIKVGVRSLSVAPPLVPTVKDAVRNIRLSKNKN
jgi:phosphoenolpyruvate-protein phosphotransferase